MLSAFYDAKIDQVELRMKCLLFALIRSFEFSLVIPNDAVVASKMGVIQRPSIKGEEAKGNQLPLVLKVHVRPY